MIWEVDGHHIHVRLTESAAIAVERWDEDGKIVYIPANMAKAEALWAVRHLLLQKQVRSKADITQRMTVFGTSWPIRPIAKSKTAYMKDGFIYSHLPKGGVTAYRMRFISLILLEQLVNQAIGKWEEFFRSIVPHVAFRKNERAPFSVCSAKGSITFDKGLTRFTVEHIEFCVFRAVVCYLSIDEGTTVEVVQRNFPTATLFEKILTYEYRDYPQA